MGLFARPFCLNEVKFILAFKDSKIGDGILIATDLSFLLAGSKVF